MIFLKKGRKFSQESLIFHQIRLRVLVLVFDLYILERRTSESSILYTYLAKLKVNAAYYTSNARELVMSLDIPYYKGTRWRFKVDFKAQQNPTNLYFGLTDLL
jgi:hypothetical protein